jgi:hypothetical protein
MPFFSNSSIGLAPGVLVKSLRLTRLSWKNVTELQLCRHQSRYKLIFQLILQVNY